MSSPSWVRRSYSLKAKLRAKLGIFFALKRKKYTYKRKRRTLSNRRLYKKHRSTSTENFDQWSLIWRDYSFQVRQNFSKVIFFQLSWNHGVTKRCRLSCLTNSAHVYEPKCGGKGCGVQGGWARADFSLAWLEAAWYSSGSGHGPTWN
jgi:hypothetical protein